MKKIKVLLSILSVSLLSACGGGGGSGGGTNSTVSAPEFDGPIEFTGSDSNDVFESEASAYTHQEEVKAPYAWNLNATGQGVTIAVMDTGFTMHQEYVDRYDQYNSFAMMVDYVLDPNDEGTGVVEEYKIDGYVTGDGDQSDHGSSVASISAGQTTGIAPEAEIVGADVFYREFEEDGSYYDWAVSTSTFTALEKMALNGYNIVNASMTGIYDGYPYQLESLKTVFSLNDDMILVAAANNFGVNMTEQYEQYKDDDYQIFTSDSEAKDNLIVVGSYFDEMTDEEYVELSGFSNYPGSDTDLQERFILAPGEMVYSSANDSNGEEYGYYTGTSMATPIVSGAIAVIKSYDSSLSTQEIANILLATADRDFVNYDPALHGQGILNLEKALNSLMQ